MQHPHALPLPHQSRKITVLLFWGNCIRRQSCKNTSSSPYIPQSTLYFTKLMQRCRKFFFSQQKQSKKLHFCSFRPHRTFPAHASRISLPVPPPSPLLLLLLRDRPLRQYSLGNPLRSRIANHSRAAPGPSARRRNRSSRRRPTSPLFSGWNCIPYKQPRPTIAVTAWLPYWQVAMTSSCFSAST